MDLAVYSRVGEQRIVPIVVANERRREKDISLELSDWTTRGGRAGAVETLGLSPKAFTLAPCAQQAVILEVAVRGADQAQGDAPAPGRKPPERKPPDDKAPGDVDGCLVVTADLRLVGCDHRPIRDRRGDPAARLRSVPGRLWLHVLLTRRVPRPAGTPAWAAEWSSAYTDYLRRASGQSASTLDLYQQVTEHIARGQLAPTAAQDMLPGFVQARGLGVRR